MSTGLYYLPAIKPPFIVTVQTFSYFSSHFPRRRRSEDRLFIQQFAPAARDLGLVDAQSGQPNCLAFICICLFFYLHLFIRYFQLRDIRRQVYTDCCCLVADRCASSHAT